MTNTEFKSTLIAIDLAFRAGEVEVHYRPYNGNCPYGNEERTVELTKDDIVGLGLKEGLIPTEDEVGAVHKVIVHNLFTEKELKENIKNIIRVSAKPNYNYVLLNE